MLKRTRQLQQSLLETAARPAPNADAIWPLQQILWVCLQEAVLSLLSCTSLEGLLEADLQQEALRLHSHLQAGSTGVDHAVAPHPSHMLLLPKLHQQIMEQRAPPDMDQDQGEWLVLTISWFWLLILSGKEELQWLWQVKGISEGF